MNGGELAIGDGHVSSQVLLSFILSTDNSPYIIVDKSSSELTLLPDVEKLMFQRRQV